MHSTCVFVCIQCIFRRTLFQIFRARCCNEIIPKCYGLFFVSLATHHCRLSGILTNCQFDLFSRQRIYFCHFLISPILLFGVHCRETQRSMAIVLVVWVCGPFQYSIRHLITISPNRQIGCSNHRIVFNLTDASAAVLPSRLSNFKAIGQF